MRNEIFRFFREVADLKPAARQRYFEQHQVPNDVSAELESCSDSMCPMLPWQTQCPGRREPYWNLSKRPLRLVFAADPTA